MSLATSVSVDRLYKPLMAGDTVFVTFSPSKDVWHLGIIVNVGRDSVDAYIFNGQAAIRRTGIWHEDDPRVRDGDQAVYFRGVFKPGVGRVGQLAAEVDRLRNLVIQLQRRLDDVEKRIDRKPKQ